MTLGQDNQLVSRDIVFLNRLADDDLRGAITVNIRCVPGIEASIVGGFEEGEGLEGGYC